MRFYLISGAVALTCMTAAALAEQEGQNIPDQVDIDAFSTESLRPGISREQHVATMLRPLRQADYNDDGLDQQDIYRLEIQQITQSRARDISRMLAYDYNGDLAVTSREIEEFAPGLAHQRKQLAERFMKGHDRDADGVVTLQEVMTEERAERPNPLKELFLADLDRDGRVTGEELTKLAKSGFDRFDHDGNGVLSTEEFEEIRVQERAREESKRLREAGCSLPSVSANAAVVGFGAYEGDSISSAYVGSPDDETSVVEVRIERGKQPLYVLLASYQPVIWRFDGATRRVEHVVVSVQHGVKEVRGRSEHKIPAAGVVGIGAAKVAFTTSNCISYRDLNKQEGSDRDRERSDARLAALIGRPADILASEYTPYGVRLPAGEIFTAPKGANARPYRFDPDVWEEAARYWPGGLVRINPDDVVSDAPVAAYDVLPSQMGLAQLVGSGAAEKLENGRYLIKQDIARIPPGMNGAHSAMLVLAEGVTRPLGDAGHGCVLTQVEAAKMKPSEHCIASIPPVIRTVPRQGGD